MSATELLAICLTAFIAVFILLSVLAVIMRLILVVFPEKEDKFDAVVISAIATTYQTIYPNTKISKIEEVK